MKICDCGSLLIVVKLIASPPINIRRRRKGLSRKWEEKSLESSWISLLSFCSPSTAALIRWFHSKLCVLSGLLFFHSNLILCSWGAMKTKVLLDPLGMRSGVCRRKSFSYNFDYQRGGLKSMNKNWCLVIKFSRLRAFLDPLNAKICFENLI